MAAAVLAAWAGVSGCLGPKAVRYTRMRYNEVVRDTNDEQLLINIVRLRYADSPVFIDLPNITSQFEVAGRQQLSWRLRQPDARAGESRHAARCHIRDTPTLSYHPREGREIAKSLLTPLSADLFSVVNAGADIEQLLLLATNDINDVPNAPRSTTLTPKVPDDNSLFVEGIRLLNVASAARRYRAGVRDERRNGRGLGPDTTRHGGRARSLECGEATATSTVPRARDS